MPGKKELPSTLKRSPQKAQNTWIKAHDSAVDQYGEGSRAHRTAFSALKHSFEKMGDHWVRKNKRGPSDPQAAQSGRAARENPKETYGGVDASKSRNELMNEARSLGIQNYSNMKKTELVDEIDRANRRKTARSRNKGR